MHAVSLQCPNFYTWDDDPEERACVFLLLPTPSPPTLSYLALQMLTIICRCRMWMQILWLQFVPPKIVLLKTRLWVSPGFQHSIYLAIDLQRKRANITLAPQSPSAKIYCIIMQKCARFAGRERTCLAEETSRSVCPQIKDGPALVFPTHGEDLRTQRISSCFSQIA